MQDTRCIPAQPLRPLNLSQRQQVVMAEEWAKTYPQIGFYTMHPGWADTPAVRTALPDFYEKMKGVILINGCSAYVIQTH